MERFKVFFLAILHPLKIIGLFLRTSIKKIGSPCNFKHIGIYRIKFKCTIFLQQKLNGKF